MIELNFKQDDVIYIYIYIYLLLFSFFLSAMSYLKIKFFPVWALVGHACNVLSFSILVCLSVRASFVKNLSLVYNMQAPKDKISRF